jgi:hypothetical protein
LLIPFFRSSDQSPIEFLQTRGPSNGRRCKEKHQDLDPRSELANFSNGNLWLVLQGHIRRLHFLPDER